MKWLIALSLRAHRAQLLALLAADPSAARDLLPRLLSVELRLNCARSWPPTDSRSPASPSWPTSA